MQIGSACSGECCLCSHGGGCIAGHGDDYFSYADEEKIFMRLKLGRYPYDREIMLKYLGISEKAVEASETFIEAKGFDTKEVR